MQSFLWSKALKALKARRIFQMNHRNFKLYPVAMTLQSPSPLYPAHTSEEFRSWWQEHSQWHVMDFRDISACRYFHHVFFVQKRSADTFSIVQSSATFHDFSVINQMLKLTLLFLAVFLVSLKAIVNHNPARLGCPSSLFPQENFQIQSFGGLWYEVQKFSSQFENGKCVTVNFVSTQITNGTLVTIKLSQTTGLITTDFEQNATIRQLSSAWNFMYNRSITSLFLIRLIIGETYLW